MKTHKRYLGDGVYVDLEDGKFVLTTGSGDSPLDQTIYLEFGVYLELERYVAEKMREASEGRKKETGQ